ncbi:hypothetical protein HYFRA_00011676 [Hymenoscyphus fraxineus]|uniref:Uncharacterized protein n=1 Tax=Hymenoscyphus fraxineus TaxID=746836 RepID=A0A9N9PVQ0_9HELO|nr:hypothetical protein HYFRA_00011676 [Hymenoscyphus fraxineus]
MDSSAVERELPKSTAAAPEAKDAAEVMKLTYGRHSCRRHQKTLSHYLHRRLKLSTLSLGETLLAATRSYDTLNETKSRLDEVEQHFNEQLMRQKKFAAETAQWFNSAERDGVSGARAMLETLDKMTNAYKENSAADTQAAFRQKVEGLEKQLQDIHTNVQKSTESASNFNEAEAGIAESTKATDLASYDSVLNALEQSKLTKTEELEKLDELIARRRQSSRQVVAIIKAHLTDIVMSQPNQAALSSTQGHVLYRKSLLQDRSLHQTKKTTSHILVLEKRKSDGPDSSPVAKRSKVTQKFQEQFHLQYSTMIQLSQPTDVNLNVRKFIETLQLIFPATVPCTNTANGFKSWKQDSAAQDQVCLMGLCREGQKYVESNAAPEGVKCSLCSKYKVGCIQIWMEGEEILCKMSMGVES